MCANLLKFYLLCPEPLPLNMHLLANSALVSQVSFLCGFLARHLEFAYSGLGISSEISFSSCSPSFSGPNLWAISKAARIFLLCNCDCMLLMFLAIRTVSLYIFWKLHIQLRILYCLKRFLNGLWKNHFFGKSDFFNFDIALRTSSIKQTEKFYFFRISQVLFFLNLFGLCFVYKNICYVCR